MSPSSLLTPPVSPRQDPLSQQTDGSLQSTIELLDSLSEYYQQKRRWVHRARTAVRGSPSPDIYTIETHESPPLPLPSPPDSNPDEDIPQQNLTLPSRWQRRKETFRMKLEPRQVYGSPYRERRRLRREQILDQFEKLMEARLESCQRLNRLVRNANRTRLIDELHWMR